MPPVEDDGWAARANGEVGAVAGALFLAAFISVPLGMPVVFMLAGSDVTARIAARRPGVSRRAS